MVGEQCVQCLLDDETKYFKLIMVSEEVLFHAVRQEIRWEAGTVCFSGLTLYLLEQAAPICFVYRSKPINQQEVMWMIRCDSRMSSAFVCVGANNCWSSSYRLPPFLFCALLKKEVCLTSIWLISRKKPDFIKAKVKHNNKSYNMLLTYFMTNFPSICLKKWFLLLQEIKVVSL